MSDHEAYLNQLNAESAKVQRMAAAAAAQRRKEEQTYYLNKKPYTHCEGGKIYDIYLLHKGKGRCNYLNAESIGFFNSPQDALNRARSLSKNVMYCPECMSNMVNKDFSTAWRRSFLSKEPFHQCVLGNATIVDNSSGKVKRMLHHKGCPHYQLKGGVDFGYRANLDDFMIAVENAYGVSDNDLQLCVKCFPEIWSSGLSRAFKEKNKTPVYRHILREKVPGRRMSLHHYGCPNCPDDASDLGWTFMTFELVSYIYPDFESQNMRGLFHCKKCMSEEEYQDILKELIGKFEARFGAIVKKIGEGSLNKTQLLSETEEITKIGEIVERLKKNSW